MSILRVLVVVADIVILGYLLGFASSDVRGGEWFSFLAVLLLIMLNIYFIFRKNKGSDTWINLFLKRKALEEREKISDLETKKQPKIGSNFR